MARNWKEKKLDRSTSIARIKEHTDEHLNKTYDFIQSLLELRKSSKLYKTYIQGTKKALKVNEENKIYCKFNFDGTVSGRLSCGAYVLNQAKKIKKGVSFHTLPRESDIANVRRVFCAPDDWVFVTTDYSGMELRVLSHISKEHNMQKAFVDGVDLHSYSGSLCENKAIDLVTTDERQDAKEASFLVVYGGTAYTLARKRNIQIKRAESVIQKWYRAYPAVPRYMDFVNNFIRENEYAYSIFGRRRKLDNVRSPDKKVVARALRQGLNFTIQSPASDILLCAIKGINDELRKRKMRARIVATVHDSLEGVSPPNELEEFLDIIHYHMIENPVMHMFGVALDVPLDVETIVGRSFGDGVEVEMKRDRIITNWDEIKEYLDGI